MRTGRPVTAIAGLSMGGSQTLEIAMGNLASYAYVGVFSSGIFGARDGADVGRAAPGRHGRRRAQEGTEEGVVRDR